MFSIYNVFVMFMFKVKFRMLRSPNEASQNKEESTVP